MSTNIFGNAPNQVPTNADLGGMAYQDPRFVVIAGGNVYPTNFSTGNAQIGTNWGTGSNANVQVGNVSVLNATTGNIITLVAPNLSSTNVYVAGSDSTSPTTGALQVVGGLGVTANVHIAGNLYVTGNTFALSTEDLRVEDSIIELHTFANLAPLTTNDGRDIGIKMHYYDVADNHAFLGRANDTGFLEWYAAGTEGVGNVFVGSNYGTVKAGEFLSVNATSSTSTTTGAVVVTGGVGIGAGLYVNGTTYLQNFSSSNAQVTGGHVTGITGGAFTTMVATNFSSGNIYQSAADTLVATNFSSSNIRTTGGSVTGFTGAATTLVATNFSSGNIYQSAADTLVATNFSSGNLLMPAGTVLHGGGIGSSGFTAGIGSPTGNLWIRGNVELTSGNTIVAPLRFRPSASGAVLSTLANGAVEYDGLTLTFISDNRYGRAAIPATIYTSGTGVSLTPTATGETTNQNLFPAANDTITLPTGTYYIKMVILVTRGATSTTSAQLRIRIAGSGTAAGTFSGTAIGSIAAGGATNQFMFSGVTLAVDNLVTAASTTAAGVYNVIVEGVMRVTTAGTFIPQYSLSAALTGATTATAPSALNFMTIQQMATSSSVAATGGFA